MVEPLENAELLAFAKAVDAKSLSRAAAELGVPRATLSRRLARLEERLGVRLLRRTTRSMAVTDSGDALYRHARIVLDAVSQAEASVRRTDTAVRGDLRVSMPFVSNSRLLDVITEFVRAYPQVRLQLHFSNGLVDLRRDGYDIVLRATNQLEDGLVARTLARTSFIAVASPEYLAEHGTPTKVRDLREHRCLMGFARGELPQTHWIAAGRRVQLNGVFSTNSQGLLCRMAVRGLGIAFVPALEAHVHLERGELVAVMPNVLQSDIRIALVYLEREFMPPQVRAFVDWVAASPKGTFEPRTQPPKTERGTRRQAAKGRRARR